MPFDPSTRVFGRQLIELASAESTNKTAAEMLSRAGLRHGTVILAHAQTAGQGQRGRSWISVPGQDLTFSVFVVPRELRADRQFLLSKLAALAVHDVVRATVKGEVRIKWPNDVLVERRKIAGILIQNEIMGEYVSGSIIGLGLNVNSTDLPEELQATSMALECGHAVDRWRLLKELCQALERRFEAMDGGDDLSEDYGNMLWARGRWAEFQLDGGSVIARPMDVDELGRLILEQEDGRVQAYGLERVRFAGR